MLGVILPAVVVESFWVFDSRSSLAGFGVELVRGDDLPLGLAVLLFSVFLPPAKLALVRYASHASAQRALLLLGHWSMLDVFVVAGTVAAVQFGVLAEARPGPAVPFFVVGLLGTAWLAMRRGVEATARKRRHGWLGTAAMVVGLTLPVIELERWFVFDRAPSVLTAIPTLMGSGGAFLGVLLSLCVVAFPVVNALEALGVRLPRRLAVIAHRWDMLSVFTLAMLLLGAKLWLDGSGGLGAGWWLLALAVLLRGRPPGAGSGGGAVQ